MKKIFINRLKRCDLSNPRKYFSSEQFKATSHPVTKNQLILSYERNKRITETFEPKHLINPKAVFANNEIDLKNVQIYGFDYDYTLAYYNVSLYRLIFNLAKDTLVDKYKYPEEVRSFEYLPKFPIRGLHLDKRKGWLMKIDSYHNIQKGTVYHGTKRVPDEEVSKSYTGMRLNIDDIGHTQTSASLHHFVDLFCLPEISLLSSLTQHFNEKNIQFNPEYIFADIRSAIDTLHRNQILHMKIVQSIDDYLLPNTLDDNNNSTMSSSIYIKEFLERLIKNNKNIFLITNSPFWFVNYGMISLCGPDWTNLFDLVICNARKPDFFTSKNKPFREFNYQTNSKSWERITSFKKNNIYYEGNLFDMLKHTGWIRNQVLYFGDHIYGDLAEPFLKHGWRTGAIINEIEHEVSIMNKLEYQRRFCWLVNLEQLIEKSMFLLDDDDNTYARDPLVENSHLFKMTANEIRAALLKERETLKDYSKSSFNPHFGSIFRSYNNPSFFTRRLSRFADIYTSNVTNLLDYPIDCHFMPRRTDLAHEMQNKLDIGI